MGNISGTASFDYTDSRLTEGLRADKSSGLIYMEDSGNKYSSETTLDTVRFMHRFYWGYINSPKTELNISDVTAVIDNAATALQDSLYKEFMNRREGVTFRYVFYAIPEAFELKNITAGGLPATEGFNVFSLEKANYSGVTQQLKVYVNRDPMNTNFQIIFS